MKSIAIVSDSHGLVRSVLHKMLSGVDRIIHAGDIGEPCHMRSLRLLPEGAPLERKMVIKMQSESKLKIIDPGQEALNLAGSIDYQQGSVVSKQLIKKESGTVTLFAFDQGEGLSEHTAPYDAMVYVLEGRVEITISKKPYILKSGEMMIMPANRPHALKALDKFKMLLIMILS